MNIVEDILARYSNIVLPIITETLFLAAVEDDIHLDCVYFLLRRLPTVLGDLQLRTRLVHADITGEENGSNGKTTGHEDDDKSETYRTNANDNHIKNEEEYKEGFLNDTSHTGKRKRK